VEVSVMPDDAPKARLVLLKDYKPHAAVDEKLTDLRRQLQALPDFAEVELAPNGRSTVVASLPACDPRQRERLKALVNEKVAGWSVIEEASYSLPKTF
jgi:hypothetical protein